MKAAHSKKMMKREPVQMPAYVPIQQSPLELLEAVVVAAAVERESEPVTISAGSWKRKKKPKQLDNQTEIESL